MKSEICVIFLAFICAITAYAKEITVIDQGEGAPVTGATVISSRGIILGATDNDGHINVKVNELPVTVRCIGYEAVTSSAETDSIFMTPATYSLSEVVVSPKERPITRVVTYVREYLSGATPTDTMQMYCEYMLERFFADGKVKGCPSPRRGAHELAFRGYARISDDSGLDSVFRPRRYDSLTTLSTAGMTSVPFKVIEEPDAMKAGASADTIPGKYFPKQIFRKLNDKLFVESDALCDSKDHKMSPNILKLFGLTTDFHEFNFTTLYNQNRSGKYGINDFISNTFHFKMLIKGKMMKFLLKKKDYIAVENYIEQYPVEIERLTPEEYKEIHKNDYYSRREKFRVPEGLMPMAPAVESLINRLNYGN